MFKNLILCLKETNIDVLVVVVEKEISTKLLEELGLEYKLIGENKTKLLAKLLSIIPLHLKTIVLSLKFKPDIFIGQALIHFALMSFVLRKPFSIFEDTENAIIPQLIANPFAHSIITPSFFKKKFGKKHIIIDGSFELAYLRSNWFNPSKQVLKYLKLSENDKFTIVRFVGWISNHDTPAIRGISVSNKIKFVNELLKFGKVIISSEIKLPKEIELYKVNIKPSEMHNLMYYANLVYGESATMAAEAAYLGTPSIYIDNVGRGYTDELRKFDLYTISLNHFLIKKNQSEWRKKFC